MGTYKNASNQLKRTEYTTLYGPTVEDRVRLADTDLTVEIEADWAGGPGHSGNEMVWGGGKMFRESMGMSHFDSQGKNPRWEAGDARHYPVDTVITGALILDWWGVVKADVGIKDGNIEAIGKAYNPETMDEIDFTYPSRGPVAAEAVPPWHEDAPANRRWKAKNFVVGPSTEVIAGNGRILTAGGVDTHVHFICPDEIHEALASGVTTLIGGGTGPAEASASTTVTPGAWHITRLFEALDEFPVNIGLLGKGNTMNMAALQEQLDAGIIGLKLHEDWGATPAVIDQALTFCEKNYIQLALHADSLNEAGFLESTKDAFKDRKTGKPRSVHIFHIEGAGGGHAPDMIELAKEPNVLPASTNPTRPFTVNTVKEHIDMLMVAHHLNPDVPEDMAFADSRIRPSTMAAEDLLHDMGVISMMSSDAQAMGRIGEMVMRTWQTAHVMKVRYGTLPEDRTYAKIRTIAEDNDTEKTDDNKVDNQGPGDHSFKENPEARQPNDNYRARRYVAKYTINPAIAHGIDKYVGSVETGKMADLVLWEPKFFGVKPHRILKRGQIAYAQTGDPNASITTPQPYLPRPVWGSTGNAPGSNSVNFAAPRQAAKLNRRLGTAKPIPIAALDLSKPAHLAYLLNQLNLSDLADLADLLKQLGLSTLSDKAITAIRTDLAKLAKLAKLLDLDLSNLNLSNLNLSDVDLSKRRGLKELLKQLGLSSLSDVSKLLGKLKLTNASALSNLLKQLNQLNQLNQQKKLDLPALSNLLTRLNVPSPPNLPSLPALFAAVSSRAAQATTAPWGSPGGPMRTTGLNKEFFAITNTRGIMKENMLLNNKVAQGAPAQGASAEEFTLEVDHNTFEVSIGGATTGDSRTEINGVTVPRAYVSEVPMAQRYFLF